MFKQFAALPYRRRDDRVEILLITTRKNAGGRYRRGGQSSAALLSRPRLPRPMRKLASRERWVTHKLAASESAGNGSASRFYVKSRSFRSRSHGSSTIGPRIMKGVECGSLLERPPSS